MRSCLGGCGCCLGGLWWQNEQCARRPRPTISGESSSWKWYAVISIKWIQVRDAAESGAKERVRSVSNLVFGPLEARLGRRLLVLVRALKQRQLHNAQLRLAAAARRGKPLEYVRTQLFVCRQCCTAGASASTSESESESESYCPPPPPLGFGPSCARSLARTASRASAR